MLLYYITDRRQLGTNEQERRKRLLQKIAEAAQCGVDYVQLREKDLAGRQWEELAREAARAVQENSQKNGSVPRTKLLINSRTDVALACGASGVHLPGDDISPRIVRTIYACSPLQNSNDPVISVSCHAPDEVEQAAAEGAQLVLFAPVFEKHGSSLESVAGPAHAPAGLQALQKACRYGVPVLALGGVTLTNASTCRDAGASGIAGIRLFQQNDMEHAVRVLKQV